MNRNQIRKVARDALVAANPVIRVPGLTLLNLDLAQAFANRACSFHALDRAPVVDKQTLMHAAYQACGFAATFGFNWDALLDALSDFEVAPVQARVLALRDPGVLQQRSPDDWATFCDVIRAADERARERGRRVLLLLGG